MAALRPEGKSARRLVLAAALPLGAFEFLVRVAPQMDPVLQSPRGHFYLVTGVAAAAAGVAAAVAYTGLRSRNAQVVCVALAFLSLAGLVALHALSTPGFLMPLTPLPGLSEQVGLALAAGWLALSLAPTSSWLGRGLARHLGAVTGSWAALLSGLVAALLANPHSTHGFHLPPALGTGTALAFAATAGGYWRAYGASSSQPQAATAYAAAWLAVVQWMAVHGTVWRASWWLHHVLQAAAVLVVVVAVARDYPRAGLVDRWRPVPPEPEALLRAALTETVRALVAATELRDPYTAGHSHRVTLAALRLAHAMGRPRSELEALARGTLVHDVGKLQVPDAILNKPGPLTAEERRAAEHHAVAGHQLCARLGFLPEELAVVRHHHERWDGTGYPDGLAGGRIPLLARIVAVVDVYDALTSHRSYRPAWPADRARDYIRAHAGTQFDPQVVAAWLRLVEGEAASGDAAAPDPRVTRAG